MKKSDLIDAISIRADITKAKADAVIKEFCNVITEELAQGGQVQLVGFGTFKAEHRASRSGRNPSTGETIQIAEANVPKFVAGKALKEVVNHS